MIRKTLIVPLLIFLNLSILIFSSGLGFENIPSIVKGIKPSVLVFKIYNDEGNIISQGSGFFIKKNGGGIITNRHVLEDASYAKIRTSDDREYSITHVIAEDKDSDLIIVSADIPPYKIRPISLSTAPCNVGERIVVIGNPLGLAQTVSDGIISAIRLVPKYGKIIQITAPISEGSSGSPIVNMKGEVIGIATFQIVEGQNINFAVPAEKAKMLKQEQIKTFAEWKRNIEKERILASKELVSKGWDFFMKGEYEKALPYFREAVRKNAKNYSAYMGIGNCYDLLEHYKQAIESYKQAIRIKPDSSWAYFNLGKVHFILKNNIEAIKLFKQAIQRSSDDFTLGEAYYWLGASYGMLDRRYDEVEALKQAISYNPDWPLYHFSLGWLYLIIGEKQLALEEYKILIKLDSEFAKRLYDMIISINKAE